MNTITQITIINAQTVSLSFSDGSNTNLKVGDVISISTSVVESPVEVSVAPVEEVAMGAKPKAKKSK